ncbi:MAG: glycosyltransferase family 2 protein, partial [Candidatus Micrarchaeota archaeon]|nr:glycosyltransferase family 2 protein [Candidatus Micrarchaeota archaeon]
MAFPIYAYSLFITVVFLFMALIDSRALLTKREEPIKSSSRFRPRTLIIVPCKGKDLGIEQNLKSLMNQDYKNYKVIAVVDSKKDPAIPYIKRSKINLLISDFKSERASGKVRAILTALKLNKGFDVYVIADSDVNAKRYWLRNLVEPLSDRSVGISTSYPKFIPVGGFWSKVKSVWGFVGEGMMESKLTRFGWGGSLAFRSDLLDNYAMKIMSDS